MLLKRCRMLCSSGGSKFQSRCYLGIYTFVFWRHLANSLCKQPSLVLQESSGVCRHICSHLQPHRGRPPCKLRVASHPSTLRVNVGKSCCDVVRSTRCCEMPSWSFSTWTSCKNLLALHWARQRVQCGQRFDSCRASGAIDSSIDTSKKGGRA